VRAVWLRSFGPPSVLEAGEAPEPVAGPGQVVIDVAFANITFVETQFRATGQGPFAGTPLPMVPGNGVGGYVAAAGGLSSSGGPRPQPPGSTRGVGDPAGRDDLAGRRHAHHAGGDLAGRPHDRDDLAGRRRVIASTGGSGGYAERVAVDESALYDVPDGLALDDAVALLADGRTATMLARAADLAPGERVLILAAAGGVGTLLVQLARGAGALVVGAVGSDRKLPLVRSLGADEAIRYEALAGDFDVVFDGVGGEFARAAFARLRRGGRLLSYGLASGSWAGVTAEEAAARGVALAQPDRSPAAIRDATLSALSGQLKPVIGQRFPLERAADAHAAIESRATIGKTLLEIS
jgi:NADPH2:quinone reductase